MPEYSSIVIQNIFHMLCYAYKVLRQRNYQDILTEEFGHVQDMLAAILCRGINQQLKQGLCRSYIDVREQAPTLRGKVNLYETRKLQKRRLRLMDCAHDEYSPDNALNQILKATALLLLRCPEVTQRQKAALRQALPYFAHISDVELSPDVWRRLQFHRNNRSYEMLMNLCYMVWQSLLPTTSAGDRRFARFDEDNLPRLYEKFILEYYRQHFPQLHAADKAIRWDLAEDADPGMIRLLPGMHSDICLRHRERILIIDAKYYSQALASYRDRQMLHSGNLYQIYAYVKNEDVTGSGNVSGLLLYARTTEDREPLLSAVIGGNRIGAQSLDLNRPFREIAAALDGIAYEHFGRDLGRMD